ncbi:PREDICTED: F-box/FBD/LRR-repeat protein At5g53840 [Camelina sativa]|uniref:F-box/FBD/LRR-repeat protein At5g53840 n=1 Tax=Camelina sativa TaxID=90675 RepID=A0ABM0WPL8_CAMSA|nr:PREDICTED: F-box/FBD/LRR-repeat protein At5g53840 [Camelina sativa]
MAKKKFCDKGLISELPDHCLCHVLSFLCTKDAIRTSVLSKRWRSLWQLVLGLDLDSRDLGLGFSSSRYLNIDEFVKLVDKFFNLHRESCIHKLRLRIRTVGSVDYTSYLTKWIDVATTRRIQHIDLHCELLFKVAVKVPLSLYTSKTLVHLRLVRVNLVSAEFVSLPCLKTLYLDMVKYTDETTLEKLISCSPVLEDLTIVKYTEDNGKVIQVRSQTLKRVDIDQWYDRQYGIVIDAPLLQFLRIIAYEIKNIKIINIGLTAKVDIDANVLSILYPNDLTSRSMIRDFLTSISRIRCLVTSYAATKDIFRYMKLEPLHQFCNLSELSVICSISNLEMLLNLLKSCPKLESLRLKLVDYKRRKKAVVMSSTVPPCLVSSLKFVKLLFGCGCGTELKVAKYFLEYSTILEKLTLKNDYKEENLENICQTLHAIPICSSTCKVVVL